jgi:peptidoglycan hydrolase-like protein with peptidoglycan-binding domain
MAAATGTATAAPIDHAGAVKPTDVCNFTTARPTLSQGSSGTAVKQLQCYLNFSLDDDPLAVDGSFGSLTEAAVLEFQRCNRKTPDGIVGSQTWGALKTVANGPSFADAGDPRSCLPST